MARRWFLAVLAAVLLAGCRVDVDVRLHVEAGGKGMLAVHAVADQAIVSATPGLAADLRFDDARAAGWTVAGPAAKDGGLEVTLTHPFASPVEATALLASLNGSDGPLHDVALAVSGDGAEVSLSGSLRVDGGLNAFADPEVLASVGGSPFANDIAAAGMRPADAVGLTFTAEFPGAISRSTGRRRGRSVSWVVPLDGTSLDVASTSGVERPDSTWGWVSTVALALLGVWVVVAGLFFAWVVWRRRRRGTRPRGGGGEPPRTPFVPSGG